MDISNNLTLFHMSVGHYEVNREKRFIFYKVSIFSAFLYLGIMGVKRGKNLNCRGGMLKQ